MIETATETETLIEIDDVFTLQRPSPSIFVGIECKEYPNFPLLYGFVANKMGFALRRNELSLYGDEQTMYKKYLKRVRWLEELQYISVSYHHTKHGYGRVSADDYLSLGLFKRTSRHSFCLGKYIDLDIQNAHLKIGYEYALQFGYTEEQLASLKEYCKDPKHWRQQVINHYELKDRVEEDGSITSAKDQAKELFIRLAFGGSLEKWVRDFGVKRCQHLSIITGIEKELKLIRDAIWNANQTMRRELEQYDAEFAAKSSEDKKKSLMATWCQTKERIIQEECIAYLVRNFPSVKLSDIISCQDGMMVLETQMKGINIELLFKCFTELIKKKLGIEILWAKKELDEAFSIPSVSTMPIDVTLDDLQQGECHIAELIAPAFKSTFKYYHFEKESWWYILNPKTKVWEKQVKPDTNVIIKTLHTYIGQEIIRVTGLMNKETDKDQKAVFKKETDELNKYYSKTGKGGYTKQLINEYLSSHLKDNKFPEKLDKTIGKLVFNDCILDLKTNETKPITPEDYISFTNDIDYLSLKEPDESKQQGIRHEFKKIYNYKDTHLEYGMGALGYSLTGDASREKVIFCLKDGTLAEKGDNGKSFIFKILGKLFPKLVASTSYKAFELSCNTSHKYIKGWKNIRVLYCDEGNNNKVSPELIKTIGDGNELKYEVLYGCTDTLTIMFKLFLCSNVLFNVGKGNDAVFNRYREQRLGSNFDRTGEVTEDDFENLRFVANPLLPDELITNCFDDLIHYFVGYAKKYYQCGLPPLPVEFAKATAETKMKNNDFAVWFYKRFEMTGNDKDRLSMDDIMTTSYQGLDREGMIKEIKKLSIEYKKDLTGFGMKKNKDGLDVYIKGGIVGYKRKDDDVDDD